MKVASADLTITPGLSDGGSPITAINVYHHKEVGGTYETVGPLKASPSDTVIDDAEFASDDIYEIVRIRACDSVSVPGGDGQ